MIKEKHKKKGKIIINQAIMDLKNVILGKTKIKKTKTVKDILHLARQEAEEYNIEEKEIERKKSNDYSPTHCGLIKQRFSKGLDNICKLNGKEAQNESSENSQEILSETSPINKNCINNLLNRCTSSGISMNTLKSQVKDFEVFEDIKSIKTIELLSPLQKSPGFLMKQKQPEQICQRIMHSKSFSGKIKPANYQIAKTKYCGPVLGCDSGRMINKITVKDLDLNPFVLN